MDPNPYAAPQSLIEPPDVIDRPQRLEMANAIRQFLNEEVTAFEFDKLLDPYRDSNDSAVRYVAAAVWYHYDDCDDHLVALSKPEWDYFQRLLLLLESDGSVEVARARRWSFSQAIAAGCLLMFIGVAIQSGWGSHLLAITVPFGIVSILISWYRQSTQPKLTSPYTPWIFPFATFSDLRMAYDAVGFRKARFPRHLEARTIRSPLRDAIGQLRLYITWLICSPVPLAFQVFPLTETDARVTAERSARD